MSNSVKVTLYALLVLLAGISGYFALSNFGLLMSRAAERHSDLEQIEPERRPPTESTENAAATSTPATNIAAAPGGTNESSTNIVAAVTNVTAVTNAAVTNATTEVAATTNALTNVVSSNLASTAPEKKPTRAARAKVKITEAKSSGHIGVWMGVFVLSLVGLGLLIANDVSHYFGNKALKTLYNDEGEGQQNPGYDKAEELWANGNHLEAIQMMREYLAKNPREQHVSIRIAEIYEKDLKNNLAAALEYEEVLKHKLQPERWGWAAIHLCNLYFRLSQEQKGFELLRRIVKEYPNTAAAEKARKRLEQVDGSLVTEQIATEPHVTAAPTARAEEPTFPASNLPPGFRPKK